MSTLRVRFATMLATAAVVPLLTYGVVSVYSLREGTRRTVTDGNLNVARQVGEQIRRYISTNLQILHALAADLDNTGLTADQQDRIFKNYVLRFPEFRDRPWVRRPFSDYFVEKSVAWVGQLKLGNPFDASVDTLKEKGVEFRVCNNTLVSRKIDRSKVNMQATIVPSGVAEVARLQAEERFAYVKP